MMTKTGIEVGKGGWKIISNREVYKDEWCSELYRQAQLFDGEPGLWSAPVQFELPFPVDDEQIP